MHIFWAYFLFSDNGDVYYLCIGGGLPWGLSTVEIPRLCRGNGTQQKKASQGLLSSFSVAAKSRYLI